MLHKLFNINLVQNSQLRGNTACHAAPRRRAANTSTEPEALSADQGGARPARLAKVLAQYDTQDLEAQQLEAEEYKGARRNAGGAAGKSGRELHDRAPKYQAKLAEMFAYDPETRKKEPLIGFYGGKEPRWWALWVVPGREKQVIDAIARLAPSLPPVELADGSEAPRELETWSPMKKVRAWNPKSGKMGARTLKYDDGGWLLLKTVLDKPFAAMLSGNVSFQGFRDREVFEGVVFPRPASDELMASVRAWEADLSDLTEEQVREELGLPPPPPVSYEDEEAEDIDRAQDRFNPRRNRERTPFSRNGGQVERSGDRRRAFSDGAGLYSASPPGERGQRRSSNRDGGSLRSRDRDYVSDGKQERRDGWYDGASTNSDAWYDGRKRQDGWYAGATDESTTGWYTGAGDEGGLLSDDDFSVWWGDSPQEGEAPTAGSVAGTNDGDEQRPFKGSWTAPQQKKDLEETGLFPGDEMDEVWGAAHGFDVLSGAATAFKGWLDDTPSQGGTAVGSGPLGETRRFDDYSAVSGENRNRRTPRSFEAGGRGADERGPRTDRPERGSRTQSRDTGFHTRRDRDSSGGRTRGIGGPAGRSDSRDSGSPARGHERAFEDDLSWWDDNGSASKPETVADQAPEVDSQGRAGKGQGAAGVVDLSLPPGTAVDVVGGNFKDFEGVILDSGGGKVKAEIDVFGTRTVVDIDAGDVAVRNGDEE